MANNRMYLVNTKTGKSICLGKYYPSTGWYLEDAACLLDKISNAFARTDFGELSYEEAIEKKAISNGGPFGDTNWTIQYEIVDGESENEHSQFKADLLRLAGDKADNND
jgi:hypothetical protein